MTPKQRAELAESVRSNALKMREALSTELERAQADGDAKSIKEINTLIRKNEKMIADYGWDR